MVSGGILNDDLSICKVYACKICGLLVEGNSVLCAKFGKLIHSRCAGVKIVFKIVIIAGSVKDIGEAVDQ